MPTPLHRVSIGTESTKNGTDLKCAVPATRAEGHTVDAHTKTTDSVFVTSKDADTLAFQGVPDVASPVVVPAKQNAARDGEGDGSDTAEDVVVRESVQFTIRANVKQSARSIIGTSRKGIAVREESNQRRTFRHQSAHARLNTHCTALMSDS
jgi:hypothetical protein